MKACNAMREATRLAMQLLPQVSKEGYFLGCIYAIYAQYIHCNLSLMQKAHATPRLAKDLFLSLKYQPDHKNFSGYYALACLAYTISALT